MKEGEIELERNGMNAQSWGRDGGILDMTDESSKTSKSMREYKICIVGRSKLKKSTRKGKRRRKKDHMVPKRVLLLALLLPSCLLIRDSG